jgi:hypothetical protein
MWLPGRATQTCLMAIASALILGACNGSGSNDSGTDNPPTAKARVARDADDLLQGPLARGKEGDYVLENDLIRVIIQQPGRNWFGLGTYGGNIIDVSAKNSDGSFNPDHMEEFITGINIENTTNFTDVGIRNDGADGEPAVICASGPDDLIEIVNPSSLIRNNGFNFPESADDRDLPVTVETCYSLAPDQPWVTLDTTVSNNSDDSLPIYMAELLNGSGEVEAFQAYVGFGEPLITLVCPDTSLVACDTGQCDQCNYLAYAGKDGAVGVSYGLIHEVTGTANFSATGVNALLYGQSVRDLVLGASVPNFDIPAQGDITLRRYFAVGDGSASSIGDIRNLISGIVTGDLSGTVTSSGEPLANASVSIFQTLDATTTPPTLFMAGNSRTDSEGRYALTLPPGQYEVQAYADGFLYANEDPAVVTITDAQQSEQNFDLPAPGFLQVSVTEMISGEADQSVPAKMQLVGLDPSPALKNSMFIYETGVFEDNSDLLPFGVVTVEFIDRSGISERVAVEPGEYQVVVSRGPRYSAYKQNITISSGDTTDVQASIVQVVETPQVISGDFHVHSIDSIDAEVTRSERVATYLAEGMDFFTPSEHSIRVDFSDTLVEMDVTDLIGTASSSEISPFDYGHFNSWPLTVDSSQISGGAVDWGREASPGMDFPEYGSYQLSPAEIYAASLDDPLENIVQINHIKSHFGGEGLAIDTGMVPPQSQTDLSTRRLDPNLDNAFDDGFDSLEVWISEGRSGVADFLGQNAGDWFNLINQGLVRTGVANSDTHNRRLTHLSNRNLIASEETDPGQLSSLAEQLAATVAQGKVVGTNGPSVAINAIATYVGVTQIAGLGLGEKTQIPISSGATLTVNVNIATPAWAQVDSIDFYVNNQPELTSAVDEPARYGVCPDYTINAGEDSWVETEVIVVEGMEGAARTEISATLVLPDITRDSWLVAVVHGTDGVSSPMFPVVPEDLDPAANQSLADLTDDNLDEGGVLAYAFTNPLFIDAGNNGWTPPGVTNASCSP